MSGTHGQSDGEANHRATAFGSRFLATQHRGAFALELAGEGVVELEQGASRIDPDAPPGEAGGGMGGPLGDAVARYAGPRQGGADAPTDQLAGALASAKSQVPG